MKQTLFLAVLTLAGTFGILFGGPFIGVAVYYLFAVLRPQYLWAWALPPGIAWSQYVAIATVLGTIALLLGVSPTGRDDARVPFARSHKLYLLFGLWLCVTCVTAQNRTVAFGWLLEYLKIFVMFAAAACAVRRLRQIWTLYVVITGTLIYIAYEVNILYVLQRRMDIYHRGYGGLDNNGAGLMLAIGIPLAFFAWEGSRRLWRWAFLAAVPLLLHAVLMSYSRGAILSMLAAFPLVALRSRRKLQFAAVTLLLALAVPIMAGQEIRARFFSVASYDVDASAASRFASWKAALAIANDHPIVGVGIRNSNLLSHAYGADVEGRTIHSQYLQILADSGYIALLIYLAAIASLWVGMRKARRLLKGRTDADAALAASMLNGLEAALCVFLVGSVFLSLEVFELPYLLALLIGQLTALLRMQPAPAVSAVTSPDPLPVT